jgi:hypothetical protein
MAGGMDEAASHYLINLRFLGFTKRLEILLHLNNFVMMLCTATKSHLYERGHWEKSCFPSTGKIIYGTGGSVYESKI